MNNENIQCCISKVKTELISKGYLTKISCKAEQQEAGTGQGAAG